MDEGQRVQAGQLVAIIESLDLASSQQSRITTAESARYKLLGSQDTERQTQGGTSSQIFECRSTTARGSRIAGSGSGAV